MKPLLFFPALFLTVFASAATHLPAFPGIHTVYDELLNRYVVPESTNDHTIVLAKKPDGWWVQSRGVKDGKYYIRQENRFWVAETGKYSLGAAGYLGRAGQCLSGSRS